MRWQRAKIGNGASWGGFGLVGTCHSWGKTTASPAEAWVGVRHHASHADHFGTARKRQAEKSGGGEVKRWLPMNSGQVNGNTAA